MPEATTRHLSHTARLGEDDGAHDPARDRRLAATRVLRPPPAARAARRGVRSPSAVHASVASRPPAARVSPMTWTYRGDPRPDIQRLVQPSGRRILDIGCGEGALGLALKRAGAAHVAGVELDGSAADIARCRLDEVVHGDATGVAFASGRGAFDYLVLADVLEHLPDPDRSLSGLLPFLKADGRVIVSVPNMRFYTVLLRLAGDRWSYTDAGVRDRPHLRIFPRRSLERM